MNSLPMATIAIETLVPRPHENKALAGKGYKQYQKFTTRIDRDRNEGESATVEKTLKIETDQFLEVRDGMREHGGPSGWAGVATAAGAAPGKPEKKV